MKFVCDQCKAKYQIADEKVAGKTVRMKCRKCGHMVEVRAAVTETSVAAAANSFGGSDPKPATRPAPPVSRPPGTPPPKPVTSTRPVAPRPPLATSLASVRPSARPPSTIPVGHAAGALAGAFDRNVREEDADPPSETREGISGGDEWYAAINGVPVGPIRLGELRRKAAIGAVTEDSLVWQEGMEEWRPAKAFPELAELLREAVTMGRPSLNGERPSNFPAASSGALSGRLSNTGSLRQTGPRNTAALKGFGVTNRTGDKPIEENTVVMPISMLAPQQSDSALPVADEVEGAAVAAAAAEPAQIKGTPAPAMVAQATPAPSIVGERFTLDRASSEIKKAGPARRTPVWAQLAVGILLTILGFTVALLFIKPAPPPPPEKVIVYSSAPVASAAPAPVEVASAATTPTEHVARRSRPAASATAAPTQQAVDLGSLLGKGNAPVLPGASGAGPSSGAGLAQDQIEGVVRSHSAQVKRSCWDKAPPDTPTTNIDVRVGVGGQGQVTSASASGSDPVIARCVEEKVRNWTFPASGGRSEFNVPFKFVRQ